MKRIVRFASLIMVILAMRLAAQAGGRLSSLSATKRFITGNIADKTRAVTEAEGDEAYVLSREALSFAKAYKRILGQDKGLSALAVAGVLSLKGESIRRLDRSEKSSLAQDICDVFVQFTGDAAVRAAVLNRAMSLKDDLPLEELVGLLNKELENGEADSDSIAALGQIGDEKSFSLLWEEAKAAARDEESGAKLSEYDEILNSMLCRLPNALSVALQKVSDGDDEDSDKMLCLSEVRGLEDASRGEAAEAVLKKAVSDKQMQNAMRALSILKELLWTRSASIVCDLLTLQKEEWETGKGDEEDVSQTIEAAAILSPMDSTSIISQMLIKEADKGKASSAAVISSCIKALGIIGDKSAFDALLAVTNAPGVDDTLKARANSALSALKW